MHHTLLTYIIKNIYIYMSFKRIDQSEVNNPVVLWN